MVTSSGVGRLRDMKLNFGNRDSMPAEEILIAVRYLPEALWPDIRGKLIDAQAIAIMLSP